MDGRILTFCEEMISELTHRSMNEFPLKWRFTDPKYRVLPEAHLAQIRPLDVDSSKRLWRYILDSDLHAEDPFREGFFQSVESISIGDSHGNDDEDSRVRKWLYRCALPFDKRVLLCWQPDCAIETTWKMLVKYWTDFYYPVSDDLTVCDESLQSVLLFHHAETVFFGTNAPRTLGTEQDAAGQSATAE